MQKTRLSIVGCGSAGLALLQLFALKTLEVEVQFDSVEIIDPDLINDKSSNWHNYPKVFKIEDELNSINPSLDIITTHTDAIFPICMDGRDFERTLIIDCRDTEDQSDLCYMKICTDGPYGKIIQYPDNLEGLPTNYNIKHSKYYALLTAAAVIENILSVQLPYKKVSSEKMISINHNIHEI